MKKSKRLELLFLVLPLVMFLIGIGFYEIQTGIIPNVVVFYAFLYFLIAACVVGLKPWWKYLLGAVILFLMFLAAASGYRMIFREFLLGGGTIKLAAVVGVALGVPMSFLVGMCFFALQITAHFVVPLFSGIKIVPSVPVILISVGMAFLLAQFFRKIKLKSKPSSALSNES